MPFTVLTVSWWSACVCVELPGVPRPPSNPPSPFNPSKMSKSLWKYAALCGGVRCARISIHFNCSPVWNTTAGEHESKPSPLSPTLLFFFLHLMRKKAIRLSAGVKMTRHNSSTPEIQEYLAPTMLAHLWLHSKSCVCFLPLSSMVCMLFPLVRCRRAVWPSASLPFLHSLSPVAGSLFSLSPQRNAKSNAARWSPQGQRRAEEKQMN